jgi:hypothetical protein
MRMALFAGALRRGLVADPADLQHAHVKTRTAVAAAHGETQD